MSKVQFATTKPSHKDELFDTLMQFAEKNPDINTTTPDQVTWEKNFSEKQRKLYEKPLSVGYEHSFTVSPVTNEIIDHGVIFKMINSSEEFSKYDCILENHLHGYMVGHTVYYRVETKSGEHLAVSDRVLFGYPPSIEYFKNNWSMIPIVNTEGKHEDK